MNLWETLLHPDREEAEDAERREVGRAANILQIGEFQLLQLAYRAWHDKDLPEALVDRLFHDYMIHNEVPHWARHYARQILRLEDAGRLDSNRPQYHRYDSTYGKNMSHGVRRFWVAMGCLVILLSGAIIVAEFSPGEPVSLFPPYFTEQQLKQTEAEKPVFDGFGRADSVQPRTGP